MNQTAIGRYIIFAGAIIIGLGLIYYFYGNLFSWMGKLPGDIRYEAGNTKVFFPITTCIVITIILNIAIYLAKKFL
jgi:Protein of unknown function (DUF2905)